MGAINIATVLVLINLPSIIYMFQQIMKMNEFNKSKFITKEAHQKDLSIIHNDLRSLSEDFKEVKLGIKKLEDIITRHDERLKLER